MCVPAVGLRGKVDVALVKVSMVVKDSKGFRVERKLTVFVVVEYVVVKVVASSADVVVSKVAASPVIEVVFTDVLEMLFVVGAGLPVDAIVVEATVCSTISPKPGLAPDEGS